MNNKWVGITFLNHWKARAHFMQFNLGWASKEVNRV